MTWARPSAEELRQKRAGEREANQALLVASARSAAVAGTAIKGQRALIVDTVRSAPKTVEHRNPHLLAMARGQRCLLRIPGVCTENRETTVACHSNLGIHGKAGARKAEDFYSCWGCMACHRWLDQDKRPSYEEKTEAFLRAHARQVVEWQRIVADMARPPRDCRAAHWALALLADVPAPDVEVPDQAEVAAQEMDR